MSEKKDVVTPWGKLSFVNLFQPRPPMDGAGEPRYSTNLIIPKSKMNSPEYKRLSDAIRECAKDYFGDKVDFARIRLPIRKGSERDYEGYDDDAVFIAPWTKTKPGVIDENKNDILAPGDVYAGQVARLTVRPFGYDKGGNKGVGLALNNVQVVLSLDAPRLDGRRSAASEFEEAGSVDVSDLAGAFDIDPNAVSGQSSKGQSASDENDLLG